MVSVTIWNEYIQERVEDDVGAVHPNGIHTVRREALEAVGHEVHVATYAEPDHGLTPEVLDETEVLVYWEHRAHDYIKKTVVNRIY